MTIVARLVLKLRRALAPLRTNSSPGSVLGLSFIACLAPGCFEPSPSALPPDTKTTIVLSSRTPTTWAASVQSSTVTLAKAIPDGSDGEAYLVASKCSPKELELKTGDALAAVRDRQLEATMHRWMNGERPIPSGATVLDLSDGSVQTAEVEELQVVHLAASSTAALELVDEFSIPQLRFDQRVLAAPYGNDEVVAANPRAFGIRRLDVTRRNHELDPTLLKTGELVTALAPAHSPDGPPRVFVATSSAGLFLRGILLGSDIPPEGFYFGLDPEPNLPFLPEIVAASEIDSEIRVLAVGTRGMDARSGITYSSLLERDGTWSRPLALSLAPPFEVRSVSAALSKDDEFVAFKGASEVWSLREMRVVLNGSSFIQGSSQELWLFSERHPPMTNSSTSISVDCIGATPAYAASDEDGVAFVTAAHIVYSPNVGCHRCTVAAVADAQGVVLTRNFVVVFGRDTVVHWYARPRS